MPFDMVRRYTEGQAERRRELLRLIKDEKRQCAVRCQPYIDELVKIENCTPVSYIIKDSDLNVLGITDEIPNQ